MILIQYNVDTNTIESMIDETDVDLLDFCGYEEEMPYYTTLMAALHYKRFDIVRKLISKGVDLHLNVVVDWDGNTGKIPYEELARECNYDGNEFKNDDTNKRLN